MKSRHARLWVLAAVAWLVPTIAAAQSIAPGTPMGGRATDTGFSGTVNSTGGLTQSVPFDFPPERTGIPLPVRLVHSGRRMGIAGLGWDLPLSYIQRERSLLRRLPSADANGNVMMSERLVLALNGETHVLVRKGDPVASTVWVPREDRPQFEVHDSGPGTGQIVMYDGDGRTYTFSNAGPQRGAPLDEGDLYLLQQIDGPNHGSVALLYDNVRIGIPGAAPVGGPPLQGSLSGYSESCITIARRGSRAKHAPRTRSR
jgi:hypothetical protein